MELVISVPVVVPTEAEDDVLLNRMELDCVVEMSASLVVESTLELL